MTIATLADVEAVLVREVADSETPFFNRLLARADSLIYGELPDIKFDGTVAAANVTIPGSGTTEFWLPGRPVNAVTSVTLDGVLLDSDEYDWGMRGDVGRVDGIWPHDSTIVAVWDYGLAAPPGDIVAVATDIVRRSLGNGAQGVGRESIDGYSVEYVEATLNTINMDDYAKVFGRYRYPVSI